MRTVADDASVRLYHVDGESGAVTTLLYGTLAEAMRVAAERPEAMQPGLYIQTSSDVVAWEELMGDLE